MSQNKFKNLCDIVIRFFKSTDFDVSVKNENIDGTVSKSEKAISVGIGQEGNRTNVKYEDNKISVSHESCTQDKKSDDTKNS